MYRGTIFLLIFIMSAMLILRPGDCEILVTKRLQSLKFRRIIVTLPKGWVLVQSDPELWGESYQIATVVACDNQAKISAVAKRVVLISVPGHEAHNVRIWAEMHPERTANIDILVDELGLARRHGDFAGFPFQLNGTACVVKQFSDESGDYGWSLGVAFPDADTAVIFNVCEGGGSYESQRRFAFNILRSLQFK
jgi:hypothetical protein